MQFVKGNVVKWRGEIHIVLSDNGDVVEMLSTSLTNATVRPSTTWPTNKKGKVIGRNKIKPVARTVKLWIQNKAWKVVQ